MGTPRSAGVIGCILLAALACGRPAEAAVTTTKLTVQPQFVTTVAETRTGARRQGAVSVGAINWACNGTQCRTSTMPSVVAAPLVVCQGLAREVGALRNFSVANRPLTSAELQQCNSGIPKVADPTAGIKTPAGVALVIPPSTLAAPARQLPTGTINNRPASGNPKNWTAPDLPTGKSPVFGELRDELGKTDQPTPPPAKRPLGTKSTLQPPFPSNGKSLSPPLPSPASAGTAAPPTSGSRRYPVSIRTAAMSVTSTGRLLERTAYSLKIIRTDPMSVTGTGNLTIDLPFTPKRIRTGGMTVTGTGLVR